MPPLLLTPSRQAKCEYEKYSHILNFTCEELGETTSTLRTALTTIASYKLFSVISEARDGRALRRAVLPIIASLTAANIDETSLPDALQKRVALAKVYRMV